MATKIVPSRATALALPVLVGTCLMSACSSTPQPNAALEQARATYNRAAADPQVVDRARLELSQSKDALDRADTLWRQDEEKRAIEYNAYLATRRAQIAEETARLKAARDEANNSGSTGVDAALQAQTEQTQQARERARAAEERADALQQELASLHARAEGGGYVLTLGDILFTTGRADLKPGAAPQLDQLASFLQKHPDRTVLVQGFTDNVGSEELNQRLSQQRANAVRNALLVRGVPTSRVRTRGYGEAMPIASNENAGGRQLNRRVQVVISDPNGRLPITAG